MRCAANYYSRSTADTLQFIMNTVAVMWDCRPTDTIFGLIKINITAIEPSNVPQTAISAAVLASVSGANLLLLLVAFLLTTFMLYRPDSESEYDSEEEVSVSQAAAAAVARAPLAAAAPASSSSSGKTGNSSTNFSKLVDSLRDNPVLVAGTAAGLAATGGLLMLLSALSKRGANNSAGGKGKAAGPGKSVE